jgi:hypothetical protein
VQTDDRVLYAGSSRRAGVRICVTMYWCVVDDDRYPIVDLENVGQRRGLRDPFHVPAVVWLAVVLGLLAFVALAIRSGRTASIGSALAVAAVGTVAVTFLPTALGRVLRRPYEIWAEYQGEPVYLFGTFDREQFGQVSRALVRAREGFEEP